MEKPFIIISNGPGMAFATQAEAEAHLEALAKENIGVRYALCEILVTAHTPKPTNLPPPTIEKRKKD
jgi:intracellular sulfur oxidation DsrE/DsrF family protein